VNRTIDTAPWFRAVYLVAGVSFLGGGIAAFVAPGVDSVRWLTLLGFTIGGVACLWAAVANSRRLMLEENGIRGRPFGLVRWADVTDVFVCRNNLNRVLALKVREPARYHEHLPGWSRALWKLSHRAGFGDLSFDITGLAVSSEDLVKLVRAQLGGPAVR
jgi:hypothetical protein